MILPFKVETSFLFNKIIIVLNNDFTNAPNELKEGSKGVSTEGASHPLKGGV